MVLFVHRQLHIKKMVIRIQIDLQFKCLRSKNLNMKNSDQYQALF